MDLKDHISWIAGSSRHPSRWRWGPSGRFFFTEHENIFWFDPWRDFSLAYVGDCQTIERAPFRPADVGLNALPRNAEVLRARLRDWNVLLRRQICWHWFFPWSLLSSLLSKMQVLHTFFLDKTMLAFGEWQQLFMPLFPTLLCKRKGRACCTAYFQGWWHRVPVGICFV